MLRGDLGRSYFLDRPVTGVLAILAVPFYVAMVIAASSASPWAQSSPWAPLALGAAPYVLFVAYPLVVDTRNALSQFHATSIFRL